MIDTEKMLRRFLFVIDFGTNHMESYTFINIFSCSRDGNESYILLRLYASRRFRSSILFRDCCNSSSVMLLSTS
jgi:hypothetical protein